MKKYQSYRPSGVEWIGDIPDYWVVGRWRYYFSSGMGQTILKEDLIENGEIPVFSATEGNNYFGYVNKSNLILENGDIVIPARGNSIGYVKIVNEKSTTTQTTIYSKRRSNKINPNFIYYYSIGKKKLLFPFVQTAIPQITVEEINSNYIIIPPLQEQEQIVRYLDEKTSIIDKLISTKERKIELLKEQRTSLINQVITKGLNQNVKMKDSGVEWIGEIPESWIVSKFKYVSEIVTGNTPSKTDGSDYYSEDGFLWIKPTYLKGDKYVYDSDEKLTELGKQQTRVIPKDSIMICCIGNTIGKYGISSQEVSTNQQINSVIPNQNVIKPWYCLYFVDVFTRDLFNRSNFVTLPILTKSDLENVEFIIPSSLQEQQEIVEFLEKNIKEIDDLVSMEQKKIELLKEYRQSLISEVITGKIKII